MAFLGLRKWQTPIIAPLWPFMVSGIVTMYLVAKAQESSLHAPEWRKDPRNPYAAKLAQSALH